jgi:imidazolonepropionase-like amidohydrolase
VRTERPTLFTAEALLAGPDTEVLHDAAVLVRGGLVELVGARSDLPVPGDALEIELGTGILAPGFIDAHVHLGFDASDSPATVMRSGSDLDLAWLIASQASSQLTSGVTTVRDLGCRDTVVTQFAQHVSSGLTQGPRIVAADAPLTVTGGHCWYMADACDDVTELVRSVRRRARDGASFVKVMLTGGFLYLQGERPHRPVYDAAALRRVVEEAHALDLRVAVHAHGVEGIRVAVEAGVDTIEHATMTTSSGVRFDPDLAQEIARSGAVVVPTLNARWIADDLPWASADVALGVIAALHDAGVRVAIGTDAGIDGVPHGRYADGVRALAHAGLGLHDVYRCATVNAAHAVGLVDRVGVIRTGAFADFVMFSADPRNDLDAYDQVLAVVADGNVVVRHAT